MQESRGTTAPYDGSSATGRADPGYPARLLLSSIVAALLAGEAMILVHELFHALTGLATGDRGTLLPVAWMSTGEGASAAGIAVTAAGPVLSLVSGALMMIWQPLRHRGGFAHLLWMWFAAVSLMEAVGYLVITPLGAGDTASIVERLGAPLWAALVMCILGVAGMFATARAFAPFVARATGYEKRPAWALAFWPWLIATPVSVGLAIPYLLLSPLSLAPADSIVVSMGSTVLFVAAPMSFLFSRRVASTAEREPLVLPRAPVAGIVALVVLVALKLALTQGLALG